MLSQSNSRIDNAIGVKTLLIFTVVGLICASAQATVLTYKGGKGTAGWGFETASTDRFDDSSGPDNHDDQAYGDRVTGLGPDANNFEYGEQGEGFTPNITVQHLPAIRRQSNFGGCFGGSGTHKRCPGNVANPDPGGVQIPFLHLGTSDGPTYWADFTADPGFNVVMHDVYVMGDLNTSQSNAANVLLKDASGNTLLDASGQDIGSNSPTLVDLGGTAAPFVRLEITFDPQGYGFGDFASDNIRFSQAVIPEPSTLILTGLGTAMLLIISRRKR